MGHRAQDQGVGEGGGRSGVDGDGEQGSMRAGQGVLGGRRARSAAADRRAQLDDVARAQDASCTSWPARNVPSRGAAVEQHHHPVALEHDGVAGGGGGHEHVGVGIGADGRGQPREPRRLARPRPGHVAEPDAAHVSGTGRRGGAVEGAGGAGPPAPGGRRRGHRPRADPPLDGHLAEARPSRWSRRGGRSRPGRP